MSYEITIKRTRSENRLTHRRWEKGGTDEMNDEGYGYTPQVQEVREVTSTILEYRADDADIGAIFKAILENSSAE